MGCNRYACRITFAIIGMVVGLSAAAAFGVVLHNPDAGVFGLLSGEYVVLGYCYSYICTLTIYSI